MVSKVPKYISRRAFIGLGLIGLGSVFVYAWTKSPTESQSIERIDVRDFGPLGDGRHDDTDAIQSAISELPTIGGTISIPDGVYSINAIKGIQLKSNVSLQMSSNAILRAIPNDAASYKIVGVEGCSGVTISGGIIQGERDQHQGKGGEWGMGISILGSDRVRIEGVVIRDCWGDGIYIGSSGKHSTNIAIGHCTAENNRRQGLSITGCIGARVEHCVFKSTHGTAPEAGIDIEPNPPYSCEDISIINNYVHHNSGPGIALYRESVTDIHIEENVCEQNRGDGITLWLGPQRNKMINNTCTLNGMHGICLREQASGNEILKNNCIANSQVKDATYDNIYLTSKCDENLIAFNTCRVGTTKNRPRYGIRIHTSDCHKNHLTQNNLNDSAVLGPLSDRGTDTIVD